MPYYVSALEDLTKENANFKIIGGFVLGSTNVPSYKIVDKSFTSEAIVNQVANITNTARFTFTDKHPGSLEIQPMDQTFTEAQARLWFAGEDAKTALLIVKSFYIQ